MVCEAFSQGESIVHGLDARARVVVAAVFTCLVAVSQNFAVMGAGLALSTLGVGVARLPLRAVLRRLVGVNVFVAMLWVMLPLSSRGTPLVHVGGLVYSREGALLAAAITLKANAIVLALAVLLGTMEMTTLGHALWHLRVPEKLTHLFLLTVRYIDVLHHEYERLRKAMRVRCFRPGMNLHTYKSFGYLVGMLLVKSVARAERVVAAMKCRGFHGRFHVFDHFVFGRRDAVFVAGAAIVCGLMLVAELL